MLNQQLTQFNDAALGLAGLASLGLLVIASFVTVLKVLAQRRSSPPRDIAFGPWAPFAFHMQLGRFQFADSGQRADLGHDPGDGLGRELFVIRPQQNRKAAKLEQAATQLLSNT